MAGVERGTRFEDLKTGDTIEGGHMLGWRLVAILPPVVAEEWTILALTDAAIERSGFTARQHPIKRWESGLGVIVGAVGAYPGAEGLNLLYKNAKGEFELYLSDRVRGEGAGEQRDCYMSERLIVIRRMFPGDLQPSPAPAGRSGGGSRKRPLRG